MNKPERSSFFHRHFLIWVNINVPGMTLELAKQVATVSQNRRLVSRIHGRLGNVAFALGRSQEAENYLNSALKEARALEDSELVAVLLNDRGNILASQERYSEALGSFTESTVLAEAIEHHALAVTALINAAWSSLLEGQLEAANDRLDLAFTQVGVLEDSHEKAKEFLSIGLAYDRLRQAIQPSNTNLINRSAQSFRRSAEIADRFNDFRTVSYGWGHLGSLYESEGRVDEAMELTRRAIHAAQQGKIPESLYQWEWQAGRLLHHQQHDDEAILAYRRAIYTLQPIRQRCDTGVPCSNGLVSRFDRPVIF